MTTETQQKNKMVDYFRQVVDREKGYTDEAVTDSTKRRDRGHNLEGDEAESFEARNSHDIESGIHDMRTLDAIKEKLGEVEREVGPNPESPGV